MMELTIRPMEGTERLYCYAQSRQISMQTGLIGHLRADMDSNGKGFFSSFDTFREDIKTGEFKQEFDDVINGLRFDEQYGGILMSRNALASYCWKNPGAQIDTEGRQFGIRVDTAHYTYMMRLNPNRGEYNLYCYCYQREWLDRHLHQAQKGIRFIDPNYKELFRIPDGEKIRINLKIGEHRDRFCRYIDETHMELSGGYDSTLYHICEFAERVRDTGSTVVPLRSSLPEQCYSNLLDTGAVVILKRGETGYYKTDIPFTDRESARALVEEYNSKLGVSKAQLEAMKAGSMFGFHVPAADPKNYDENGQPIRPTARGRGEAR